MKSESIIIEKLLNFPKLMESVNSSTVVLFTSPSYGTVVNSGTEGLYELGYISTNWEMSEFKDYEGRIILEN